MPTQMVTVFRMERSCNYTKLTQQIQTQTVDEYEMVLR
jgi:hypothetical protein